MTTYYVDNAGSNTSTYDTWAKAANLVNTIAAIDAAGDTIYVASTHNETTAGAVTWAFAGTSASPTKVICGTTAATPPTTISAAAAIAVTGANNLTITGSFYIDGLNITVGDSTNQARILIGTSSRIQELVNCSLTLGGNNSGGYINVTAGSGVAVWKNVGVKFAHASQYILAGNVLWWYGGSLLAGGTAPTGGLVRGFGNILVEGVDLSQSGANALTASNGGGIGTIVFKNCKLPASVALVSGSLLATERVEVYNADSADTNYRLAVQDYYGTIDHETTVLHNGGANDGTTNIGWKMASTANASYYFPLRSPEIVVWNDVDSGSITVTVEVATNNVTLKDDECWLEVDYQGTASYPLGVLVSDSKANALATAANQDTSSETWSSVPGTPVKQYLRCTLSPTGKGVIMARVCVGKASTTVYVDPKLTVADMARQYQSPERAYVNEDGTARQYQSPSGAYVNATAAGGSTFDISATAAVAVSGTVTASGDIQIGSSFDLAATALAVTGALTASGDIGFGVNLTASDLAVSGALSIAGDIEIGTGSTFDIAASAAVALSGALTASGDIQIGTAFDLAASAIDIGGTLSVAGDISSSNIVVVDPGGGRVRRVRAKTDKDRELELMGYEERDVRDFVTAMVGIGLLQ